MPKNKIKIDMRLHIRTPSGSIDCTHPKLTIAQARELLDNLEAAYTQETD